ncbi:conserved membrane protein of unknown function [Petrocella atlantisensis]|uniref:Uncharacterized protein n=1 Tax=Petrocella atlantisensis TaxID=2173034 RepID=A0A3P7NWA3_9FIRM|nr:hypothetical protein [Petrocella atlantisensis]VDN47474.1 conserved membrane protein of unknown function [Petrocella atlantisensis]
MTEGYKKMFWGAMFVSFAGVSGLVALLMTLAGWVIIVAGLGNNDKKSLFGDFSKLRLLTIRLAAVSVTGGVLYLLNHSEMISFAQLRYYPLIHIIIQLIVFHKILEETVLNFDWMDRIDAARKYASKDRNFTLLMGITIAAFLLFYIFNQPLMRAEGIAAFAASKIYLLWIIYSLCHENHEEMLNDGECSFTLK